MPAHVERRGRSGRGSPPSRAGCMHWKTGSKVIREGQETIAPPFINEVRELLLRIEESSPRLPPTRPLPPAWERRKKSPGGSSPESDGTSGSSGQESSTSIESSSDNIVRVARRAWMNSSTSPPNSWCGARRGWYRAGRSRSWADRRAHLPQPALGERRSAQRVSCPHRRAQTPGSAARSS